MLPLFDMLNSAQNGRSMELLARQFNLSQQQAQLAVEALLPAFSQGLKRNAADPYGVGAFMTAMASGQHAKYFEDAGNAFSAQGVQQGNDILGQLFGSKDLSRAVAAQAAQATGIGQSILQQMLPVIASMIMGGLTKQSTGQMPGTGSNPLTDILGQMMGQGGATGGQAAQPQGGALDNPFGKILEGMFGGQAAPSGKGADPMADNPFGKMLQDMFGGAASPGAASAPQPDSGRSAQQPKNPYDEIFGKMFETGQKTRDEYQKSVETIFDQFSKGLDRYR